MVLYNQHMNSLSDLSPKKCISKDLACMLPQRLLKGWGPYVIGNDIFFHDTWFEAWADYPHAQRFIIGHELGHVEKSHLVTRVVSQFGTALLGAFLLHKACASLGFSQRVDDHYAKSAPWLSPSVRSFFGKLFLCTVSLRLAKPLGSYVYRAQEFEADMFALEKLGPLYGHEVIVQGAADFLKRRGWI